MGWIKERIVREKKKYDGKLDWALVAESKIQAQIMSELDYVLTYGLRYNLSEEQRASFKNIFNAIVFDSQDVKELKRFKV